MEKKDYKCFFCGGSLSFDGQDQASELFPQTFDGDEDAMVHNLHCLNCGREYEITDPTLEERNDRYKNYWQ